MNTSIHTKNSKQSLKLLTGVLLVFIFAIATVILVSGPVSGLSPISTAWAAPNCDSDGDGSLKDRGKCGGDDPDDSDPCNPNPEAPACVAGGNLGSAISMDCTLGASWGDGSVDTIKGDKLDFGVYSDAADKVNCSIGGPSVPWPIRLGMGVKGRPENSVRKVDITLGAFEGTATTDTLHEYLVFKGEATDWLGDRTMLESRYPELFLDAPEDENHPDYPNSHYPDMDKMEPLRLNVRPYRETQTRDGIHLLQWSAIPYEMGMTFSIPGTERFSVSIASEHYPGNESFTGISCETGYEEQILAHAPGEVMRDVSVYLWRDGLDDDDLPDGYTITTGKITPDPDPPFGPPRNIEYGARYAAVCSSFGERTCGNPKAPSKCNFLGYVAVQFTMHTEVK